MKQKMPVAIVLIILNTVGFGLEVLLGEDFITSAFGMYEGALSNGEWIRLTTHGFLHFGFTHFASNMLCLGLFGYTYEHSVGSIRFALVYLFSLMGSGLMINFFGGYSLHAGASGGIWGLMGAVLIYTVRNHKNPVNAIKCIAVNVIYTFTSSGISWQGHVGGIIGGVIAALIFIREPKHNDT